MNSVATTYARSMERIVLHGKATSAEHRPLRSKGNHAMVERLSRGDEEAFD